MDAMENGPTDSDHPQARASHRSLVRQASVLWELAADQRCWGFVFDAAETRRLALELRARAILAEALASVGGTRGPAARG